MAKPQSVRDGFASNRAQLLESIDRTLDDKGLNRKDLPRKAGVSQQTVKKLFDPAEKFTGLRSDAVLRIAKALQCSVEQCQEWLLWTGHESFSTETIKNFLRTEPVPLRDHAESMQTPAEYFGELIQKLQFGHQILMCVCITSKPAPIDDEEMKAKVIEALQAGLCMALVCPYPCGELVGEHYEDKPNLIPFYDQVFTWTRALCGQLRSPLESARKKQIQIFVPRIQPKIRPFLVPPVLRQGAPRPSLVKIVNSNGDSEYQLGSYGRREKQWLMFYPASTDQDTQDQREASEICNYWRDYFKDLLMIWQPHHAHAPFRDESADWSMVNPDGSQPTQGVREVREKKE